MSRKQRRRVRLRLSIGLLLIAAAAPSAHAQNHDFHGSDQPEVLDAVVVTAGRLDEYAGQHPGQVEIMAADEIEQRNMLSVEEALQNMAGVDVQKSATAGSRISIRGSSRGSSTILILLNGRPLNSSQYGGVELSTIPIDIVESITVFKPPVPVWLGPGGSDGAISIVTRNARKEGGEEQNSVTKLRGGAGSYGQIEASASQRLQFDQEGGAVLAAEGLHKDGKRTNSDADSGSLNINWNRQLAENGPVIELGARYFGSEYGSAGPMDNPTPNARQSYQKGSVDSKLKGDWGDDGEFALALYGDYIDLEDNSQSGLTSTLNDEKFGLKAEDTWTGDVWSLRLNTLLKREDVDHTLSGEHHRVTAGLGAQADRSRDAVVMTLGLRGDHTNDFDFNPGFSSGLSYEISKRWLMRFGAGYSVNIPTFGQLYQPSHGTIDQTRGNPDLDAEKIWSYDAALKYGVDTSHQLEVTLFRSETSDPIVYQRGQDCIYRPVNADRSWRQGVEVIGKWPTAAKLTMDVDLIVQDSEIGVTGNELAYTPRIKAQLTIFYVVGERATKLETTLRYRSEQYSEAENIEDQRIDDYITVDLKVTQPCTVHTVAMEWFVTVHNLFDVDYQIHYGYPDDGIRFLTGINMTF